MPNVSIFHHAIATAQSDNCRSPHSLAPDNVYSTRERPPRLPTDAQRRYHSRGVLAIGASARPLGQLSIAQSRTRRALCAHHARLPLWARACKAFPPPAENANAISPCRPGAQSTRPPLTPVRQALHAIRRPVHGHRACPTAPSAQGRCLSQASCRNQRPTDPAFTCLLASRNRSRVPPTQRSWDRWPRRYSGCPAQVHRAARRTPKWPVYYQKSRPRLKVAAVHGPHKLYLAAPYASQRCELTTKMSVFRSSR